MADQFDNLFESLEVLKRAVESHNNLPDEFPASTIVGICNALLLGREGSRASLLDPLVYARDKLAVIQSEHFVPEEEAAKSAGASLTRRDSLHNILGITHSDLHAAILSFAASDVDSAEESGYASRAVERDATTEKIAAAAGTAGDGLKEAQQSLEDRESAFPAGSRERFKDAIRSFIDARIAAALIHIEAISKYVRKAWLDRLRRTFSRIPERIETSLRMLADSTPAARIVYNNWHKAEGAVVNAAIDAVENTANELADWLETRPGGPDIGLPIFRDIREPWCPELVEIPPGEFVMGSPPDDDLADDDEKPQHPVKIAYRFAVGRYPVTFDEYDAFCGATGRDRPGDRGWGRNRRPVINVSWEDARDYVEWLSRETGRRYRLLTEAEWEYACRAGSATRWSFGNDESELGAHGWFDGNSAGQTHPVGELSANDFGLHDMHGNVWEWVEDVWHDSYAAEGRPDDGSAWNEGGEPRYRVLRGGSWYYISRFLRSANRTRVGSDDRSINIGFRVARTLS